MSKTPNYYEVLGVPESAAAAQIKKKYRELVRIYHPDVAGNKAEAHRMFIKISEAYEVLSDTAARNTYDRSLETEREKERKKRMDAQLQRHRRYQGIEHSGIGVTPEQKKVAMQHVRSAQMAFIQRRLQTATSLCKDAIAIDPRNAQAHTVLGDIYKIKGKVELAIKHYSFALQFDPSDRDVERKLTEVLSSQINNSRDEPVSTPGTSGYYITRMNTAGWALVGGMFVAIKMLQSSQLVIRDNSIITTSSLNLWLLPLLLLIGFLVGSIFAANRWIGSPSKDLFSVGRLVKGGGIPLGYIAFICSFFNFWITASIYFTVALLRGDTSRSVLRLIGATIGILILAAFLYRSGQQYNIMFWGGNLVFPGSVLGWYCGHVLNPIKRYGWSE